MPYVSKVKIKKKKKKTGIYKLLFLELVLVNILSKGSINCFIKKINFTVCLVLICWYFKLYPAKSVVQAFAIDSH